ncbi:hypothetical protein C0W96_14535 [Photobacterium kishitanii]|uniref:hypothetical protein n=1 Tax=Photobacterium kishitanii TaxID=318456 RepID=UPI000D1781FB|nr:hypothetical protein [Photobacterium kishitanii]PSV05242.1 hypothetical protein C0W96_14535 [Photobacterium kishitanii]PSV76062.1 hypothetical protein C0W29_09555 [Photobacterium kishitanii]
MQPVDKYVLFAGGIPRITPVQPVDKYVLFAGGIPRITTCNPLINMYCFGVVFRGSPPVQSVDKYIN